jgi:hypothetical protein
MHQNASHIYMEEGGANLGVACTVAAAEERVRECLSIFFSKILGEWREENYVGLGPFIIL